MKITLLINRDLPSCVALNNLASLFDTHDMTIFLSSKVGHSSQLPEGLRQLQFFEQELFNEFLFPALSLSNTAISAELLSFGGFAELCGKPIRELNRINDAEEFELFRQSQPDLVLSIRYGVILEEAVIAVPEYGVLNLHSGLLPDYKGVMATFRAMLNGESEIGMTLHYIDNNTIDTGPVVATTSMSVDKNSSYLWHVLALYRDGCQLILDAVNAIEKSGSVTCATQSGGGNYYSFPDNEELASFSHMGYKLVDLEEIVSIANKFVTTNNQSEVP